MSGCISISEQMSKSDREGLRRLLEEKITGETGMLPPGRYQLPDSSTSIDTRDVEIWKRSSRKHDGQVRYEVVELSSRGKGNFGGISYVLFSLKPSGEADLLIRSKPSKVCKYFFSDHVSESAARNEQEMVKKVEGGKGHLVQQGDARRLFMPLCHGVSLQQMMDYRVFSTMSFAERVSLGLEVVRALKRVHDAGVVHRDLSHANVVMDRKGGTARLVDFGFAHPVDRIPEHRSGNVFSLAPEVFYKCYCQHKAPAEVITPKCDHYGLAGLLLSVFGARRHGKPKSGDWLKRTSFPDYAWEGCDRLFPEEYRYLYQCVRRLANLEPSQRPELREVITIFERAKLKFLKADAERLLEAMRLIQQDALCYRVSRRDLYGVEDGRVQAASDLAIYSGDVINQLTEALRGNQCAPLEAAYRAAYERVKSVHEALSGTGYLSHRVQIFALLNTILRPLTWILEAVSGTKSPIVPFKTRSHKLRDRCGDLLRRGSEARRRCVAEPAVLAEDAPAPDRVGAVCGR